MDKLIYTLRIVLTVRHTVIYTYYNIVPKCNIKKLPSEKYFFTYHFSLLF